MLFETANKRRENIYISISDKVNIDDNVDTFQIIRQAASHVVKFTRKKKRFVIFEFERLFCWYKNTL